MRCADSANGAAEDLGRCRVLCSAVPMSAGEGLNGSETEAGIGYLLVCNHDDPERFNVLVLTSRDPDLLPAVGRSMHMAYVELK